MKQYTTIPNNISSKLNSLDTYRFTCLSFTPRKDGYTDATFKQIAEVNNVPESDENIKNFVDRLKVTEIINIEETFIKGKRRNKYFISNVKTNFRMISKSILEAELPIELKGFFIQLATITINNTLDVELSINKICTLIKISKPTASKYLKEMIELGYITKLKKGYRLHEKFMVVQNIKEKQIMQLEASIKGCIALENRFYNTDWKNIVNPKEYWKSVEGGYTGLKSNKPVQLDYITL